MAELKARRLGAERAGEWRRASYCQNGECLEILQDDQSVMVRDSAHPEAVVCASTESWRAFRDAVKAGELDDLG
jgi:Domain of unknown function (DUF397)